MHSAYDASGEQVAWDSTSLNRFVACPRLYYYSNIIGWKPKSQSIHLTFGALLHSAREFFDRRMAKGDSYAEALRLSVHELLVTSADFKSLDKYKNRETLLRTFVWYLEQYKNDGIKTVHLSNGAPAVELSFRFELNSTTLLCGHLDKLVLFNDEVWVADLKTTKQAISNEYAAQYNPGIQMPLYTLAGQVVYSSPAKGVLIDAAQILIGGTRFHRFTLPYTKEWLTEWMLMIEHKIALAHQYFQSNYWPMNPTACHKFGGCQFRGVCSRTPAVRQMFLEADFEIDKWDPLKTREVEE